MVIMMNYSKLNSMAQIKSFLAETKEIEFNKKSQKKAYRWIEENLRKFTYVILSKKEKGFIRRYLMKVTGYSKSQLTRHINQYRKTGQVRIKEYDRHQFQKKYTHKDIQLLAKTAQLHASPNAASLKKKVSYLRSVASYQKTNKGKVKTIGVRCKPKPEGKPGYLKVDTIHQGDQKKTKRSISYQYAR